MREGNQRLPLSGLKVLDFMWQAAGPWATALLADYGATVIRIESETFPDLLRGTPPFKDNQPAINHSYGFCPANSSKLSMALNLDHPQGPAIARRLVAWADVVTENFSQGTMAGWGLDYEELVKIKSDLIMLSSSPLGQTGPWRGFVGFGFHLQSLVGVDHFTGWPDRPGVPPHRAYTDYIAPWYAIIAILSALDYRRRTGKGQYVDLSQFEAGLTMLGVPLMDYGVNRREGTRQGNRSPRAAPHGVFPCQGEDQWVAIAIYTQEQWRALCQAAGHPEWANDPRFATFTARKRNEAELEKLMAGWTQGHTAQEVASRLQAAGVAAGPVWDGQGMLHDPQLQFRRMFRYHQHQELGEALHIGSPIQFSEATDAQRVAPCLGEHTEYVCREVLKMADEEFLGLLEEGVLQ